MYTYYVFFFRMKEQYILLSTDGPYENVLKIKPPVCFTKENVDYFCAKLEALLREMQDERDPVTQVVSHLVDTVDNNNKNSNSHLYINGYHSLDRNANANRKLDNSEILSH